MHLSQLNNSLSKQLYSFSKAQRFPKSIQSPCKQRFYNYKLSTKNNRSTSFGYGQKIDLANKQQVPAPGVYNRRGEFTDNLNKRRGHSFSRHSKRSIINEEESVKLPGPGQYDTDKDVKFSHLKYSFRSKFQSIYQRPEHSLGPGQYKTLQLINKDGHQSLAKYEDSQSRRFTRSARFEDIRSKTPGPGACTFIFMKDNEIEKLSMNKTGSYFHSRFRSNLSNSFGRSERPFLGEKTFSPGPGKYDFFSEFNNSTMR